MDKEQRINEQITQHIERVRIIIGKMNSLQEKEYKAWLDYFDMLLAEDQIICPIKSEAPEIYIKREDLVESEKLVWEKIVQSEKINDKEDERIELQFKKFDSDMEKLSWRLENLGKTESHHESVFDVFDPERDIMRALSKGRGDLYGLE